MHPTTISREITLGKQVKPEGHDRKVNISDKRKTSRKTHVSEALGGFRRQKNISNMNMVSPSCQEGPI